MLLIREGKKVQSSWYCKPTDTGLVMNYYHAMAPRRYKRGVDSGFVHRIHRACIHQSSPWFSVGKAGAGKESKPIKLL